MKETLQQVKEENRQLVRYLFKLMIENHELKKKIEEIEVRNLEAYNNRG